MLKNLKNLLNTRNPALRAQKWSNMRTSLAPDISVNSVAEGFPSLSSLSHLFWAHHWTPSNNSCWTALTLWSKRSRKPSSRKKNLNILRRDERLSLCWNISCKCHFVGPSMLLCHCSIHCSTGFSLLSSFHGDNCKEWAVFLTLNALGDCVCAPQDILYALSLFEYPI